MVQIKTEIFEGPLELLLDLIEKNKLSINQVSLATITDEYIMEVKARVAVAPDEVAQFLVIASTLMLIKSRSLLPNMTVTDEEEQNIRNLEERLAQLRKMRECSGYITLYASRGERMYARTVVTDLPILFYPPKDITPSTLRNGIRTVIRALPYYTHTITIPEKSMQRVVSLEEKISELMVRVEESLTHSFKSFIGSAKEKTEIIVSFLALLELVKEGHVIAEQGEYFGDIAINKKSNIMYQ
jgi:segregation and condensation protein A